MIQIKRRDFLKIQLQIHNASVISRRYGFCSSYVAASRLVNIDMCQNVSLQNDTYSTALFIQLLVDEEKVSIHFW